MSVAVVIACKDAGEYIGKCIASALNQTVRPDQIILVDGFSNDETVAVAASVLWREPYKLISAPPKGMANARNIGIMHTSCDYIVPLDADDWLELDYIERCVAQFGPGIGIVAPSLIWEDGSKRVQHPKSPFSVEHLLEENCIFSCSMFSRLAWSACGGYDEHLRTYEDWELWLRMVADGWGVIALQRGLCHYLPHAASSSARMKPGDHEEYVQYIRAKHAHLIQSTAG